MTERFKQLEREYYEAHSVCPKCGYDSLLRTTAQALLTFDYEGHCTQGDANSADCRICGWTGTVNDLVPTKC